MLRSLFGIALTLATLCATGCTSSDPRTAMRAARSGYPTPGREAWPPASDAKLARAKDLEMPGILPETHFAAARLFESQGLFAKAIHQYRKTIAVQHHHTEAYHRLGLLLSLTGQREEALKAFTRAVELKPDDAILRNNLGFELMLSRRWADAERELSRAIRLRPGFPRAYINQGIVRSKLGRFDEALASFRTALPEADAYYNLGLMYRGQQRYAEAAGAFHHVLALNPDFVAAQTQLEQIEADQALQTPSDGDIRTADTRIKPTSIQPTILEESKPPSHSTQTARQKARGDGAPTAEELAEIITILESELARAERELTKELDTDTARGSNTASTTWQEDLASVHAHPTRRKTAESIGESRADETVSPAYTEEPVSYAEIEPDFCDAEWDGSITPDERLATTVCPAEPTVITEPPIETISCVDSWALLRELEEQLSIVRNEIECLESSEAGSSGLMSLVDPREPFPLIPVPREWHAEIEDLMMGPPAPGEDGRWTDARLVVDVVNQQRTKGEKQPIARESLLNIAAPTEEPEAEIDADTTDETPGKTTKPARRPLSWQGTLDRLEELFAGTPGAPAVCTSGPATDRQRSTERHAGLHRELEDPSAPPPR